jgi:aminopeptidase-like protein
MINNKLLIRKIFNNLWPINRSITGMGFLKSLKIIKKEIKNLKIKKIKSGTKVFDWKIPKEWNVNEAWIKDENGNEILNYKNNNLHLMGYSTPVNRLINYKELNSHLFSINSQPNAIPYVTSYYNKNWGFCLKYKDRKKLDKKKKYRVYIKSKLSNGFLRYGEIIIPGKSKKEILISTYLCHPSLANNELSGPILTLLIANWLKKIKKNNYTYRIIFIPETIGSISYIKKNLDILKKRLIAGFVITCVGDDRNYSYLASRNENTVADRVIKKILKKNKIRYKKFSWLERGSDERQYCSPGVDLPVASLMRTKYGEYKEYHTSLDKFGSVVTEKGILSSLRVYKKIFSEIEKNIYPTALNKCEPQMSKRNLYPKISMKNTLNNKNKMWSNILSYSDGKMSAEDMSKKININYKIVLKEIKFLEKNKLIEI